MDNMGFVANMVSMVLYFMLKMHFDLSGSANTLTNFMGSSFLLSIVGGLISDTLLTRFHTCLIFGMLEILVRAVGILINQYLYYIAIIYVKVPTIPLPVVTTY